MALGIRFQVTQLFNDIIHLLFHDGLHFLELEEVGLRQVEMFETGFYHFGIKVLQQGVAIMEVFLQLHKILVGNGLQGVGISDHLLFQAIDFLDGGLGLMSTAKHHDAGEGCDECESGLSHVFSLWRKDT